MRIGHPLVRSLCQQSLMTANGSNGSAPGLTPNCQRSLLPRRTLGQHSPILRYSGDKREYDIDTARKRKRWRYVGSIPAVSSFSTRCRVFRLPGGGGRDPSGWSGFVR